MLILVEGILIKQLNMKSHIAIHMKVKQIEGVIPNYVNNPHPIC